MKTPSFSIFSQRSVHRLLCVLLAALPTLTVHGADTTLADEPFLSATTIRPAPNIMFALDDSGSMNWDYLPDWAGPEEKCLRWDGAVCDELVVIPKPVYQAKNAAFNGLAYNPGTRYSPPVMFDADNSRNTALYPSMTGESVATGGDAGATSTNRNWKAVPNDAYGIQRTDKSDLQNAAFYYQSKVGEYCAAKNLRVCIAAGGPTVEYPYPAPLRWCNSEANAQADTATAGTNCQATRVDPTYIYPRFAQPRIASITASDSTGIDNLTVDGKKILSAPASGGSKAEVTTSIMNQINACTYHKQGNCEVVGYLAWKTVATADTVWIAAPGEPAAAATVLPASAAAKFTVSSFTGSTVPGVTLHKIITSTTGSYPKGAQRTDCAGASCTYAEEMTNYANWWAYYRTRMQSMKTAASRAFLGIDGNFRVGYLSINDGSCKTSLIDTTACGNFLGVDTFEGAHRNLWYSKFFAAKPWKETPLRTGLSTVGRYYAGKVTSLYGEADICDPMQHSCQKNYTILSTDGYWNDTVLPKQIDGVTPIGNQDNSDPRPYYDGGTWKKTTSYTTSLETQLGVTKKQMIKNAWQLQADITDIKKTVKTTETWPFTLKSWQLQEQTTPLVEAKHNLEQRIYQLQKTETPLTQGTQQVEKRVRRLFKHRSDPLYADVEYDPRQKTTLIKKTTYDLQTRTDRLTQTTYALQQATLKMRSATSKLQKKEDKPKQTVSPLKKSTYKLIEKTYKLKEFTHTLTETLWKLQRRRTRMSGESNWVWGAWEDVPTGQTCTVGESNLGGSSPYSDTQCNYVKVGDTSGKTECRPEPRSLGSPFTLLAPVDCVYVRSAGVDVSSCTAGAPSATSPFKSYTSCEFSATFDEDDEEDSCTAQHESEPVGTPLSGTTSSDRVTCEHHTTANVETNGVGGKVVTSCTETTDATNNLKNVPKITCSYGAATATDQEVSSCTNNDHSSNPKGTAWNNDKRVCGWSEGNWAFATSCKKDVHATVYTSTQTHCQFGNTPGTALQTDFSGDFTLTSCTQKNETIGPAATAFTNGTEVTGDRINCQAQLFRDVPATAWTAASGGACTASAVPANFSATGLDCRITSAASAPTNPADCTPKNASLSANTALTGTTTGDKVTCTFTNGTWADVSPAATGTCTPSEPALVAGKITGDRTSCQYEGGTGTVASNQESCDANATSVAHGSAFAYDNVQRTRPKVLCEWQAEGSAVQVSECTYKNPSLPSEKRTICSYTNPLTADRTNASNLETCSGVAETAFQTSTADDALWKTARRCINTGTREWSQETESCKQGGDLTAVPPYSSCGYEWPGTVTSNLDSCTVDAPQINSGLITGGSITECSYQRLANNRDPLYSQTPPPEVDECTKAVQSPHAKPVPSGTANDGSAPLHDSADDGKEVKKAVICAYGSPRTTDVSSGTDCKVQTMVERPGGLYKKGVSCNYSNTIKSQNLDASSCSPHVSPYYDPRRVDEGHIWNGDREDCRYAEADTGRGSGVDSCRPHPSQDNAGAQVLCTYGSATEWSDTATCSIVAESPGSAPVLSGPARNCQYKAQTDQPADNTCTGAGDPNLAVYDVAIKKVCDVTDMDTEGTEIFPHEASCSTAPTDSTNGTTGVRTQTETTCVFNALRTENVAVENSNETGGTVSVPPSSQTLSRTVTHKLTQTATNQAVAAEGCTAVGVRSSIPRSYSSTGSIVECEDKNLTPTGPEPADCILGRTTVDGAFVRSTCVLIRQSGPSRVESCTNASPSAPSYVRRECRTFSPTDPKADSCIAKTAAAPDWETVSCTANSDGTSDTLADVAAYYYKTDLRTPALGNCGSNDLCDNGASGSLPQRMNTFTLGMGASGYMQYSPTYMSENVSANYLANPATAAESELPGDFPVVRGSCGATECPASSGVEARPTRGVCSWQSVGDCNWPAPAANKQTTIDDLWHAGVNGRGEYFSASNPDELANSISAALSGVMKDAGLGAGVAVSSTRLQPGESYVFGSNYTTNEWSGDVKRFTLNSWTGLPASQPDWSAQVKLDAKLWSDRQIYTFDSEASNKLKAFTAANFGTNANFDSPHIDVLSQFSCAIPEVCLLAADKTAAAGSKLVNYLRGDRGNEGVRLDNSKYFRKREHVLGDIVNARPVYVKAPIYSYNDKGYADFKSARKDRRGMVYVAANDGMLHAFAGTGSATTEQKTLDSANKQLALALDPSNNTKLNEAAAALAEARAALDADTEIGQEKWAYIPSMVLPKLALLADKDYDRKHRFLVDATPAVADVCFANCAASDLGVADWRTILVGGLGKGGRAYYALDITDPDTPKALWEFTDDNLGYTYGTPQIGKLADGTWVVLFASGYNNGETAGGDGVGRLFVLKAKDGTKAFDSISTGVGGSTDPSGLARIAALSASPMADATMLAAYAGDLLGNLWRFDLNNTIAPEGREAQLLAKLKNGSDEAQPITARPTIAQVRTGQYIVIVGTGKLLSIEDSSDGTVQSIYGLIDRMEAGATTTTAIYDNPGEKPRQGSTGANAKHFIVQQMEEIDCPVGSRFCSGTQKVMKTKSNSVVPEYNTTHNGWFIDLIHAKERADVDMGLALGTLLLNTHAPTSNACDLGGVSYQYWLDYESGAAVKSPDNPDGLAGKLIGNRLVGAPAVFITGSGSPIVYTEGGEGTSGGAGGAGGGAGGAVVTGPAQGFPVAPIPGGRRASWRELIGDE